MRFGRVAVALCAAVPMHAGIARAQSGPLTLADVLVRAREQAPQIVSSRLAMEEARARLVGASLRLQANPELDAAVGSRQGVGARSTELELGIAQMFEPGSRRSARIGGANAAIDEGTADLEETTRIVLRAAAAAYFRALHAREHIRLLAATQDVAAAVYAVADRRFKAGDIAVLDVNLARASLARVRSEREAAEAARILALGDLRQLLRLEGDVSIVGELVPSAPADLAALLASSAARPELRALEAGVRAAEAEVELGRSFSKPDYGFGVRYEREEGDHVVLGGFRLTFPVFSRGQELRAVGSARAARLRAGLEAARWRVQLEVRSAFDAYQRRLAAVGVLRTEALPGMDENETLTTRSFEVGQLGLPELLLVRREILDTRFQYVDALLEAALARIDLDASAAILR
jgi:cobalt-zinc-cadmium efflux system outer membrane protein